jgi:GDSL-like Lipase/Acylhydrolase family
VRTFSRYVAIGDSSTEGLEDPDGKGGYRGWADRLAEIIANAQAEPLDYANLGVRSLHLREIRTTQFAAAMRMQPDLFSVFGGANDMLSVTSSTTRSSKTPACSPKTGCTATNSATSGWPPPWPGGSASTAPTSPGPSHSPRRCPGCGHVNSSPRTSNGLDDTSRPGSAEASGGPHTAPQPPRNGPC